MKLGYCYNCDPRDLTEAGADRLYADHAKSDRSERAFCIQDLREGDELILLRRADLGVGKEIPRFEQQVADLGATITIVDLESTRPLARKPGPSRDFQPDYRQETRIRNFWHGPFKRSVALAEISKEMGREITANTLNKHLGPRSKPGPWINKTPDTKEA